MGVTLAQAIARRGGGWCVWIRIESIGDFDGGGTLKQATFCSKAPQYAATDPTWKPYLARDSLPRTLTERVNPLGGVKDVGQFQFNLVDRASSSAPAGYLTNALRWDAQPFTRLTQDLSSTATTAHASLSGRTLFELAAFVGAVIFIGQEAAQIVTLDTSHLVLTRAVLGTNPAVHFTGDPVKLYPPRLEGRDVVVGIVPYDATDSSQELELDRFSVQQIGFTDDWTSFAFKCVSRLAALIRTVGAASAGSYQLGSIIRGQTLLLRAVLQPASAIFGVWPGFDTGYEDRYFLLDGKEYITANANSVPGWYIPANATYCGVQIKSRARLGTSQVALDDNAVNNQMKLTTPLVADMSDGIGSFRFSPGPSPSTSRSSGTWTQSDHFVDIMLCLMLSSAFADDGLELVNYPASHANHSSLEVGWGAGIRVARVNVDSFLAVKDRVPDWRFPAFILDSAQNLADVLNSHFLQPLGCYITTKAGQLTLVLPRLSYAGQSVTVLDKTKTLRQKTGPGTYQPRMSATYDPANQARAVLLKMTAPNGDETTRLITATQFGGQLTQYDAPIDKNAVLQMSIPGIRADQAGADVLCEQIAIRRLFREFNPPRLIDAWADLSMYGTGLGDVVQSTADLCPNPATGTRGVTAIGTVVERGVNLDVTSEDPAVRFRILDYGPVQAVGLNAPSANINAFSFPAMATHATLTIGAQVYTDAAASSPLPNSDAAQFAVGMVVKLLNQDGTLASPSMGPGQTQVITNVILTISGGNQTLWIDGDFNGMGSGLVGKILVLADYDAARSQEQVLYTAAADAAYQTVGAGAKAAWLWGEP